MNFRTRFAPSPTGPLHLGHAYSALLAFDTAQAEEGEFFLRLDDIDQSRSRDSWADQIEDDLRWLGLRWPEPVWRQSQRLTRYREALHRLWDIGLLYPCACTRADIRAAAQAPQEGAPLQGPDGVIYPGTCRQEQPSTGPLPDVALRLNMAAALERLDAPLSFIENGKFKQTRMVRPENMVTQVGDVALARPGMGASYHLSIVCDDFDQKISHVIRGEDLFDATQIHVLLQRLLGFDTPVYHHHRLIRDNTGKRLAKRDDARAIATYREADKTPNEVRGMVGLNPPSAS
ncbi:MAG: tRNA glutamyl-Q(34) synthetase GluQRS [Pseudomonadota bacterium]